MRDGAVPDGWRAGTLADLIGESDTGTWGPEDTERGVPILRSTNFIGNGALDFSSVAIRDVPVDHRVKKRLLPGDILLERSGGGPQQPVGRVAVFSADGEFAFGNFVERLRANAKTCDQRFLYWLLSYLHSRDVTLKYQQATTGIRNLRYREYLTHEIAIPPLSEQRKITEVLSSVDDAIERTEAVIEQVRRVKQGLARQLLTRGLPGRHTRFKQTEVGEVPEEWEVVRLGECVADGPTNGLYRHISEYGDGTSIVRIDDFEDGEFLRVAGFKRVRLESDEVERYLLTPRDILINRVNSLPQMGKCALVPPLIEPSVYESNMMRLTVREDALLPEYCVLWLCGASAVNQIQARAKRAVAQASINQTDVRTLLVALPPIEEQAQIVLAVGEVDSRLKHEQEALAALRQAKRNLMHVLLTGQVRVRVDDANDALVGAQHAAPLHEAPHQEET